MQGTMLFFLLSCFLWLEVSSLGSAFQSVFDGSYGRSSNTLDVRLAPLVLHLRGGATIAEVAHKAGFVGLVRSNSVNEILARIAELESMREELNKRSDALHVELGRKQKALEDALGVKTDLAHNASSASGAKVVVTAVKAEKQTSSVAVPKEVPTMQRTSSKDQSSIGPTIKPSQVAEPPARPAQTQEPSPPESVRKRGFFNVCRSKSEEMTTKVDEKQPGQES